MSRPADRIRFYTVSPGTIEALEEHGLEMWPPEPVRVPNRYTGGEPVVFVWFIVDWKLHVFETGQAIVACHWSARRRSRRVEEPN